MCTSEIDVASDLNIDSYGETKQIADPLTVT